MTDDNNDNNNNNFNDLEWIVSEEINKCDGCSGSCFLRELIEEQRKGLITEEEIVEKLKLQKLFFKTLIISLYSLFSFK